MVKPFDGCRQKLKKTLKCKCKCTCTADNNETWDDILKSEQLDIITSQEKAFDMTVIEEIGVLNLAISSTLLQRLPSPRNLLNYKETIDMACYVLKRDHSKQSLPGIEIKYGSPSWQCFIGTLWPWRVYFIIQTAIHYYLC